MSDRVSRLLAPSGLVIGAVLGMAGTFVPSASLRALLWGLDGVALIAATALLTVHYFRRGNDLVAAGFLVFVVGETLIVSSAAMDLVASGPVFAAGVGLWAASLTLISAPNVMPRWVRVVALIAGALVRGRGGAALHGACTDPTVQAIAFLRLPFPGCHSVWLGLGALSRCRLMSQDTNPSWSGTDKERTLFLGQENDVTPIARRTRTRASAVLYEGPLARACERCC